MTHLMFVLHWNGPIPNKFRQGNWPNDVKAIGKQVDMKNIMLVSDKIIYIYWLDDMQEMIQHVK